MDKDSIDEYTIITSFSLFTLHPQGSWVSLGAVDKGATDEYTCTADNGIGEAVSATTRLFVNYPPEVAIEKVR